MGAEAERMYVLSRSVIICHGFSGNVVRISPSRLAELPPVGSDEGEAIIKCLLNEGKTLPIKRLSTDESFFVLVGIICGTDCNACYLLVASL